MEWPSRLCVECDSILKATLIGSSDGLSQAFQEYLNVAKIQISSNTIRYPKTYESPGL